jgi:hypothetical protein
MSSHEREQNRSTNDPMTKKMREVFDLASDSVDPATGNRLRLMRRDALANGAPRRSPYRWFPLGAAAAAILGVGLTWWLPQQRAVNSPAENNLAATDPDLLPDDDTEIYTWLGDAPVATNDTTAGSQ